MRPLNSLGLLLIAPTLYASGIYNPGGSGSSSPSSGSATDLVPGDTDYIQNRTTSQTPATLFVDSGTVKTQLNTPQIKWQAKTDLMLWPDGTPFMQLWDANSTHFGYNSGVVRDVGTFNTSYGSGSMPYPYQGYFNNCFGNACMGSNLLTGQNNNGMGYGALAGLTGGYYNNAMGGSSAQAITTGQGNTAVGAVSLGSNVSSDYNTAVGYRALFWSTATANIGIGYEAGTGTDTVNANGGGDHNIYIGVNAGQDIPKVNVMTNSIAIGYNALVHSSNTAQVGGRVGTGQEINMRVASATVETGSLGVNGVAYRWPGTQASGTKILSNDGSGNLSWAADATGAAGAGDNLGNHIATMTLTANYGFNGSTITMNAFDASASSLTVSGAAGLRVTALSVSLPVQTDASKGLTSAAIDLSGSQASNILAAARFPALTGDITTSAGGLGTSAAASQTHITSIPSALGLGSAGNAVSVSSNAVIAGTTFYAGSAIQVGNLSASSPVQTDAAKNLVSASINLSGGQVSGTLAAARMPALTGDITTSAGGVATTAAASQPNITSISSTLGLGSNGNVVNVSSNAVIAGTTFYAGAAIRVGQNIIHNGVFTSYNSTTTVGSGMTSIVVSSNPTGSTTQGQTVIYQPTSAGMYRFNGNIVMTTAGTAGTFAFNWFWTADAGSQKSNGTAAVASTAIGNQTNATAVFYAGANTQIKYSVDGASLTGSPVYTLHIVIERL